MIFLLAFTLSDAPAKLVVPRSPGVVAGCDIKGAFPVRSFNQRPKLDRGITDNAWIRRSPTLIFLAKIMNYRFFVDDGWSGANFERPSFKEMIEGVENGEIKTIITKELSRLGRNYLQVGMYTELHWARA